MSKHYSKKTHYKGGCDRPGCALVNPHDHKCEEGILDYYGVFSQDIGAGWPRPRGATYTLDDHGGQYADTVTVRDLIDRLRRLPADSMVAVEEHQLLVVQAEGDLGWNLSPESLYKSRPEYYGPDRVWTVLDAFHPENEHFSVFGDPRDPAPR